MARALMIDASGATVALIQPVPPSLEMYTPLPPTNNVPSLPKCGETASAETGRVRTCIQWTPPSSVL
jgi:hypothetical protein